MAKKKAPKKLIVSMKSSSKAMSDFKKAFEDVRNGRLKGVHYEISFDNKKGFNQFVKNIGILSLISKLKPKSVNELAKLADLDVSKLSKVILFFEEAGVIKVTTPQKLHGIGVKNPAHD